MKRFLLAVLGLVAVAIFPACSPLDGSGGGDPLDGAPMRTGSMYLRSDSPAGTSGAAGVDGRADF